jgi:hypothetical protein
MENLSAGSLLLDRQQRRSLNMDAFASVASQGFGHPRLLLLIPFGDCGV